MSDTAASAAIDAPAAIAPQASDLCTHCGLCCDGAVFDRAKVYEQDLPAIAAHGISVFEGKKGLAFPLPCPRLDGACCTIYADRFTTCRKFRCELLLKLDAETIDFKQAAATVTTAKSLVAAVEPAARVLSYRPAAARATQNWIDIVDPAERSAAARRQLAIVALERYLNTHFRHPKTSATDA